MNFQSFNCTFKDERARACIKSIYPSKYFLNLHSFDGFIVLHKINKNRKIFFTQGAKNKINTQTMKVFL